MKIPQIVRTANILTSIKPSVRAISLMVGDIVKAEVMDVVNSGTVSLRITPETGRGGIILAKSRIPMTKGENMLLKVIGGDREIKLQYVGIDTKTILKMLSDLSGSRLSNADLRLIKDMFKSIPESLKASYPEFKVLQSLMPGIERLNSDLLRTSVEGSGLLFETRLRSALQELMRNIRGEIVTRLLETEPDQKGLLLRLREILKNSHVIEVLKSSGFKSAEITSTVDRLINNIEFFQLMSRINDMLYTFLPVSWQELKDGELSFKKNRNEGKRSYTCDINLDLEPLGKLSISVTLFEGTFYITFNTGRPETKSLITAEKGSLEKRFTDAGLPLKIINVGHKHEISFGVTKQQGLDLRV